MAIFHVIYVANALSMKLNKLFGSGSLKGLDYYTRSWEVNRIVFNLVQCVVGHDALNV